MIYKLKIFFKDINECAEGSDNCSDNASCTNTIGGFECACASGFEGNTFFAK